MIITIEGEEIALRMMRNYCYVIQTNTKFKVAVHNELHFSTVYGKTGNGRIKRWNSHEISPRSRSKLAMKDSTHEILTIPQCKAVMPSDEVYKRPNKTFDITLLGIAIA